LGSLAILSERKWTEPSQNPKLAPPGCMLPKANRVPPLSLAQQVRPPAYLVLIGQLGRPMIEATPTPGGVVSRPGQRLPICQAVLRSPISSVLLAPSMIWF